ncbi:MAG: hypothetical protein KF745_12925 [Phycisphaeraceae bacterium]|nr:hypothetical protein [Phycisphaeraceae bacterium]
MTDSARRRLTPKTTGLLLAVAFALIGAGVTLFLWARSGSSPERRVGVIPTPKDIGKPPAAGETGPSGWGKLTFVQKEDPTRAAGELQWEALEPTEERGRSNITKPRAWIYLRDGRTLHIQAEKGRIYMPEQGQQPESGRFEGGVLARLYDPTEASRPVDLDHDRPVGMYFSQSANFDMPKGEFSTLDPVLVATPSLEFRGSDMVMVFNRVLERLEFFELRKGDSLRFTRSPASDAPPKTAAAPPTPAAPSTQLPASANATPAPPPTPRETIYQAVFGEDVKVRQMGRTLAADALDVWVRLIDNQLPPAALGPSTTNAPAPEHTTTPAAPPSSSASANPASSPPPNAPTAPSPQHETAVAAAGDPVSLAGQRDDDIVLTWAGRLTITPIETAPSELARNNHIALRFTADKAGKVTLSDTDAGVSGSCVWIGYLATMKDLILAGRGANDVVLKTDDGKRATVGRFEINLASGVSHIPGGGVLEDNQRRITWSDQADYQFATGPDHWVTGTLEEAAFTGSVVAKDKRSTLSGEFLHVAFMPVEGEALAPSHVKIEGNAKGDAGDGGQLRADTIDVRFQRSPDGRRSDPELLTAVGSVQATRRGATLKADWLEAGLTPEKPAPSADGAESPDRVAVSKVWAKGSIEYTDLDSVRATADELHADAPAKTALLTGPTASVGKGRSIATGERILLDGARRDVHITTPGRFTHRQRAAPSPSDEQGLGETLEVTWGSSMRFDDLNGQVECDGEVVAATDPDGLVVRVVRGDRLTLALSPAPPQPADAPAANLADKPLGDRRLLHAAVFGSEAAPATAEARWYEADAAADNGKRLTRFLKIYGATIDSDPDSGVMSVPGAGRAAAFDGRSPDTAQGPGSQSLRGASLFTWTGGMNYNQASGALDLLRGVTLVHRPLNGGEPIRLESESLQATMRPRADSTPDSDAAARGTQLTAIAAQDAVYVESGLRKLIADTLSYDATTDVIEAAAAPDNRITLYDDSKGTVLNARKLRWDRAHDRVEIKEPSPITAPR